MAKIIKYEILCGEKTLPVKLECKTQADFDGNYPIAEKEAVGEIMIEGEFETEQPTHWDMLEAQVTYTAMMTDTLLEV